jgi:ATP-dependent DNA helicase RecG
VQAVPGPLSAGPSLDDGIDRLPGVGPRTAERLRARGLGTIEALLFHLPRAYEDLRQVTPIAALASQPAGTAVLVRGTVARVRIFPHRLLDVFVEQDGMRVRARWFRPPRGMQKSFTKGAPITLAGPLRKIEMDATDGASAADPAFELVQPSVQRQAAGGQGGEPGGAGIRARYPMVAGVSARILEKIVAAAVDRYGERVPEALEAGLRARLGFPAIGQALRTMHARPGSWSQGSTADELERDRAAARRRLAFEDLLVVQLGLGAGRRQARAGGARPCAVDREWTGRALRAALPFELTAAQAAAIDEIARDLAAPHPMQRLLVGDVGSGKTAVAFAAAAMVAAAGGQTLLMAPTELLVEQHLRTLGGLAAALGDLPLRMPPPLHMPLPLRVARFTASMSRAERAETLARCRSGEIRLLVGTQALLESPPELADLRLAIVDEQHRFGVAQRARLRRRGSTNGVRGDDLLPHLLVMSATPIPRTLALTLYGDLDASFLRELPPGRQPVLTLIFSGAEGRAGAQARLEAAVRDGRQAYVVCPVRASTEREGAVTAVARAAALRRALRPAGIRVGLLHGALGADEKESRLRAFAAGDIDVLVATTVVELGIDVPNATVMLVEEADRFGLAQLHQLRGRVGRGAHGGACLLCTSAELPPDSEAARRLTQLVATRDGFRIAEADLAQRGHGELFGARQAGTPRWRLGDASDYVDLLEQARAERDRIEADDPGLARAEHGGLRAAVLARWAAGAVYGAETG